MKYTTLYNDNNNNNIIIVSVSIFFLILGLHLRHVKVPRLGVELELQLPAYITATATPDLSCICDLHLSLRQHRILNPLNKARDWTPIPVDTSWVLHPLSHNGNSSNIFQWQILDHIPYLFSLKIPDEWFYFFLELIFAILEIMDINTIIITFNKTNQTGRHRARLEGLLDKASSPWHAGPTLQSMAPIYLFHWYGLL